MIGVQSHLWNKLMENFTLKNFIFDMDNKPPEYFYEEGGMELPTWYLFSALKFTKYEKYESNGQIPEASKRPNNDVGGSFFRYLTKDCPKKIRHGGISCKRSFNFI